MQDVLRFWLERGAAGYRVDAIDRLLKDAQLRDDPPASEPFGLPLRPDEAKLALTHSRNAPDTGDGAGQDPRGGRRRLPRGRGLSAQRQVAALPRPLRRCLRLRAASRPLAGRPPAHGHRRHAPASPAPPGRSPTTTSGGWPRASVPRMRTPRRCSCSRCPDPPSCSKATRSDRARARAASESTTARGATATATRCSGTRLPRGASPAASRGCRRSIRSTTNVEAQRDTPGSTLRLVRELIRARRELSGAVELLDADPGVLAFRRGGTRVADQHHRRAAPGRPARERLVSRPGTGALRDGTLAPHAGVLATAP